MDTMKKIEKMMSNNEYSKLAEFIIDIPEKKRTVEMYDILAICYCELEEFDLAVETLELIRDECEDTYYWQYRMGIALYSCQRFDEAAEAFENCISMNPPEEVLNTCEQLLYSLKGKTTPIYDPEFYDENEIYTIENHIEKYFGNFEQVYRETYSPDIHVDIALCPPTPEKNYYTLVTIGMGAHKMTMPKELAQAELDRIELCICLPPDWDIFAEDQIWYWPISLLKFISRLPIKEDSWIGFGHSVACQEPFADNTAFCGAILSSPNVVGGKECTVCKLPNGESVHFLIVRPIYQQELNYKLRFGYHRLLDKLDKYGFVVDIDRPDTCANIEENDYDIDHTIPMDIGGLHTDTIEDYGFDIDVINGYNHISIYLRWCIENDLMSEEFLHKFPDVVKGVKNKTNTDLRQFIHDELEGNLTYDLFNEQGIKFAEYYYSKYTGGPSEPFYPADVDSYALEYFGDEKYHSEEFEDEAYLFVPFDEDYYNGLKKYIEMRYHNFLESQNK